MKLVLGSGDNCLHCFVENVFEKKIHQIQSKSAEFYECYGKNIFGVFFYAPQCTSSYSNPVVELVNYCQKGYWESATLLLCCGRLSSIMPSKSMKIKMVIMVSEFSTISRRSCLVKIFIADVPDRLIRSP
jgi:hypothetical protein